MLLKAKRLLIVQIYFYRLPEIPVINRDPATGSVVFFYLLINWIDSICSNVLNDLLLGSYLACALAAQIQMTSYRDIRANVVVIFTVTTDL